MSEILPGGGAPLPSGGGYGFDDADEAANRRPLIIGGGIAAAVLVLIIAFLLLHGGGGGNDETGLVPGAHTAPPVVPTTSASSTGGPKAHQSPGTKLPPKTKTRLARDPFKVLFGATGQGTTGGTTTTGGEPVSSTSVTPGPTSSSGTVVVPTEPSEGGTPSAGTGGVTTHGDPIWIELVRTNGIKTATFDVGYQDHKFRRFTVSAPEAGSTQGTIFDNEFSLLSIQGNEVTIQVGDDTPFDLRKGVSHQLV